VFALYQDYCVLGCDSLLLGYQCFRQIRCLHNRGTNFSLCTKIHVVLCQKLVILIHSWQSQAHACFNTHFTSRRPHVSLWTSMKTVWNKLATGNCQFVKTTEEAGVYYCLFLYRMLVTQIPGFLNYSTFRYAKEYFNSSVPAQYLQTWDITLNADTLFVAIFHRILIQYNRREQHTARGPHRPTWVRGAALATFIYNDYLQK